jgi:hypothetical protein
MAYVDFDDDDAPRPIPPPIPAFSLRGSLSPLLIGPALIPALAVLFAPVDILDRVPLLRRFTGWMVAHVPYMDVHANSTIYPQMALLVNCMVVALVPYLAAVVLCQSCVNYPYLLRRQRAIGRSKFKQHLVVLLGPMVFTGAIAAMVILPGDPSWALGTTTHRRGYFYAFLAFFMPFVTGSVIGAQVLNVRLFIDLHLRKGATK